jgi:tetratricopeptide (TPR) repeat protein
MRIVTSAPAPMEVKPAMVWRSILALAALAAAAPAWQAPRPGENTEMKEFQAAAGEKDPVKKMEALKRFLGGHATSPMASQARRELVVTFVKIRPAKAARETGKLVKPLKPNDRATLHRLLAGELLGVKQQLGDAEKAARAALKEYTYTGLAAELNERAARAKGPAPSAEEIRTRYNSQRGPMEEILGQVLLARGKTAKAEAVLASALRSDPSLSSAAIGLGEIAAKKGDGARALELISQGYLGRPSAESRTKLTAAYVKAKGSESGLEEYLDARYKVLFPNPLPETRYQPDPKRSNRLVLAELYTGAGCPPCVAADLAFDSVLEDYSRRDVAVVVYHEHIPRPDPLTNSDTIARWKWQEGRGVPTYGVDGEMILLGGGPRDAAVAVQKRILDLIGKDLDAPSGAKLSLEAENNGQAVRVKTSVSGIEKPGPDLMLNVALVEKLVRYSGENGIRFHPMVVRSLWSHAVTDGSFEGVETFKVAEVQAALKQHLDDFEKHDDRHNKDGKFRFAVRKDTVDASKLAVVAFVQDSKTRKVLQAAWADAPVEGN